MRSFPTYATTAVANRDAKVSSSVKLQCFPINPSTQ